MTTWINGSLRPDDGATVSAYDHGFTVGDGVFETVKVARGTPVALTRHLRRLSRSAAGMGFPELDEDFVRAGITAVLDNAPPVELARLRITVTAGPGALGSDRGMGDLTVVVAFAAIQPWPPSLSAVTVPWVRNERSAVVGLKTTSYAENVVALAFAKDYGASEAIFANTLGNLCEGTGSNVFVVLDDTLVTPPLSAGCLAGITRELVVGWADVVEEDVPLTALTKATEVMLTSSTRDVQAVHELDGRALPGADGPVVRKLGELYAAHIAASPDP